MVRNLKNYTIGDGSQQATHSPLQNSLRYERVKAFLDEIEKEGWNVAAGGKVKPSSGYFINPTIIDKPADDARIVVEEQFGMLASAATSGLLC
jgi:acyl-CoA reductase-like NAD-dependent aldehyde dehydrogenase